MELYECEDEQPVQTTQETAESLEEQLGDLLNNSSISEEVYENDILKNKGENDIMRSYGDVKLPIGKYTLSTYRYALNMYIQFRENQ